MQPIKKRAFKYWRLEGIVSLIVGVVCISIMLFMRMPLEEKLIYCLFGFPAFWYAAQEQDRARLRYIDDLKFRIRCIAKDNYGNDRDLSDDDWSEIEAIELEISRFQRK